MTRRRAARPGAELCTFVIGPSVAYLHSVVCSLRLQSARTGVEGWEESSTGQRPSILLVCACLTAQIEFFNRWWCTVKNASAAGGPRMHVDRRRAGEDGSAGESTRSPRLKDDCSQHGDDL